MESEEDPALSLRWESSVPLRIPERMLTTSSARVSDQIYNLNLADLLVPVDGTELDFTGNCGNMAAGVGPFAVE
jgi:hypothetical protein